MNQHSIPKITIEQWATFKAVVDEGSHAAAAEVLNKSQSTISYLLARLNEQLPAPAVIVQGRKTTLTDLGAALYRHASNLLAQAMAGEELAQWLSAGWESQLRLACDALTPTEPVMCALQRFSTQAPLTRFKILETTLSGTDEAILNHDCDLAIAAHVPPGFLANPLLTIRMVAVAHESHPLTQLSTVSEAELKTHRQIVVRDTGTKREQDSGWLGAEQRWTVSHFATSVEIVESGLGFAFIPEHRIRQQLNKGVLRRLNLEIGSERHIPLNLVAAKHQHGPGVELMMNQLQAAFTEWVKGDA